MKICIILVVVYALGVVGFLTLIGYVSGKRGKLSNDTANGYIEMAMIWPLTLFFAGCAAYFKFIEKMTCPKKEVDEATAEMQKFSNYLKKENLH